MSLLDLLGLGGAPAMAAGAQGQATVPPPSSVPSAASAAPPATPPPSTSQDVVVTGHRPSAPVGGGYNNMDEVNAIRGVQAQYPTGPAPGSPQTGLVSAIPDAMPGAGTLRSLLGTLGDAFLIQSGHQPAYAQRMQREQIANASAGFDTDPSAAAARIAMTGAPGSIQDAQTMYTAAQNEKLRQATLENTQQYRDAVIGDREQNHQAAQQIAQGKADDRARSLFGGRLAAVANDPTKYAATRSAIAAQIAKMPGTTIDPDVEFPTDPKEFNAAYGLNANQYQRNQQAATNSNIRQNLGQQNVNARYAGIAAGVSNNNKRVAATYAGQADTPGGMLQSIAPKIQAGTATPQEQQIWTKYTHVGGGAGGGITLPPGLQPQGGDQAQAPIGSNLAPPRPNGNLHTTAPTAQFSQVHTYPSGRKAGWNGHAWVPIN